MLKSLPCDIFLGAHGDYFGLEEKYPRMKEGGPIPSSIPMATRHTWPRRKRISTPSCPNKNPPRRRTRFRPRFTLNDRVPLNAQRQTFLDRCLRRSRGLLRHLARRVPPESSHEQLARVGNCGVSFGAGAGHVLGTRKWIIAVATIVSPLVANIANIAYDLAKDPASHNLFPFELLHQPPLSPLAEPWSAQ